MHFNTFPKVCKSLPKIPKKERKVRKEGRNSCWSIDTGVNNFSLRISLQQNSVQNEFFPLQFNTSVTNLEFQPFMIFFSWRPSLCYRAIVGTVYILKVNFFFLPSQVLPLFSSGVIHTPPARSSTKTRAVQLQPLLLLFLSHRSFLPSLEMPRHLFNREMRHIPFSKT